MVPPRLYIGRRIYGQLHCNLLCACGGSNADQIELEDCENDVLLLKKFMFEGFSTTIHVDTMSPVAANAPTTAPPTTSLDTKKKKKDNKTMTLIAIGLGAAVVTLVIGYISMLFFTKKERKLEREKEQMFKMVRRAGLPWASLAGAGVFQHFARRRALCL